MLRPARRCCGISVVEMLFALALLSILLSIAVPSFAGWLERNRVRGATESIHAGIQLARTEALARNARVRFTMAADGNWSIACTTVSPGCPDLAALHSRSGAESRGSFAMAVNGTTVSAERGVTFNSLGRPDTTEADRIASIDIEMAAQVASVQSLRALRIVVSDFGRTRMCYPHAPTGNPTRC